MKRATTKKAKTLKREINPMPKSIRTLLVDHQLLDRYKERPSYQRNDYLGWISKAKLETTKEKRINQMVEELKRGDQYMKMKWSAKKLKD